MTIFRPEQLLCKDNKVENIDTVPVRISRTDKATPMYFAWLRICAVKAAVLK